MWSVAGRAATLGAIVLALALAVALPAAAAAATYAVDTPLDLAPAAGECAGGAAACSLRQALDLAQSGDSVQLAGGTFVLGGSAVAVRGGVTIAGAGSAATTISAADSSPAFELLGGPIVTIRDLTITHAHEGGEARAGAINAEAKTVAGLTLEGVTISDSSSPGGYGGALQSRGEVTIRHSRFVADSTARGAEGGGGAIDLIAGGSSLTVSDSVFEGNSAAGFSGGAILVERHDSASISASTFTANTALAGGPGGAIEVLAESSAVIANSTFDDNTAGSGGAISAEGEALTLNGDTLAGNGAQVGANLALAAGTSASAENTIFAAPFGGGASCAGHIAAGGHDLEDSATSSCGLTAAAADVIGLPAGLQPPADNASLDPTAGGPPQTMAPAAGSPALGAGGPSACAALAVDERGFPRAAACDIGAYEHLPAVPTATALSSSRLLAAAGETLTLSVRVSPGRVLPPAVPGLTGAVRLYDGAALLGSTALGAGSGSFAGVGLAPGAHELLAVYEGDALYAPSSSAPLSVVVAEPAPVVAALRESSSRWREGPRLATIARRRRDPIGTTFSFRLNTPANLSLTFARMLPGRRAGHSCVAPRRRDRRRACTRLAVAGTLRLAARHGGVSRVAFAGRLSRTRRLAPGRYLLLLSAANGSGRSATSRIAFTILRG